MFLLTQAALFLLVFVAVQFVVRKLSVNAIQRRRRLPPSLPSLPLVGSLPFLRNLNNIGAFFMEKSIQLGPIFSIQAGSKYVLVLNSKDAIEEALVKNLRTFSSRPDMFVDIIGNRNRKGIAFNRSTPARKKTHRIALSIFKEFGFGVKSVMEEWILTEVEAMAEFVVKKRGRAFDPHNLCAQMSSNVMTTVMFGHRRDYELGISHFIKEMNRFATLLDYLYDIAPVLRYVPPFSRKVSEMLVWSRSMYDLIEREIQLSLRNQVNSCFVRRYVEIEGPDCDLEELNYLLRDVVSGGTNTVADTLQWTLAALADHPAVQTVLGDEIDATITPKGRLPTLQDEARLPFVAATVLELLRWRTLLPISLLRATANDASTIAGYHVPANTSVITNLYAVHNDPCVWKDPLVFRPERFLDQDRKTVINKDRIIPFGLGRRSCFGEVLARAEIFLILTSLVQRFRILPPEGQKRVDATPELPVSVTLTPLPYSIRIVERH